MADCNERPIAAAAATAKQSGNAAGSWTPGQWWHAPQSEVHYAYYLLLRRVYGFTAHEAIARARARAAFAEWPAFMKAPIGSLRQALRPSVTA